MAVTDYVTRALFNASILSDLQKELTRPKAQAAILKIDEKPDSNGKLSLELTITPLIPALQIGKRIRTKVQTVLKKNEPISSGNDQFDYTIKLIRIK